MVPGIAGRGGSRERPERVLALRAKGLSLRAIAAETGVSVMTVQHIVEAAHGVTMHFEVTDGQRSTSRIESDISSMRIESY